MEVGNIFCVISSYGNPKYDSVKQFLVGSTRKFNGKLFQTRTGGSLLANAFNVAWVQALNMVEAGEPITHFAMLHDDVVPDTGWLDVLMEDIQKYEADLVSVVIPIKDGCGLTSTAIDDPGDPFNVERRLVMDEIFRLPEVFTAADCGYPDRMLLTNTGCWVCDFTKPWRYKVKFTIEDVIRKGDDGRWTAGVASEDWNFARMVQREGGKVMATRRVGLNHVGDIPFSNRQPWGEWKQDKNLQYKFREKTVGDRTSPFMLTDFADLRESKELPDVEGLLKDEEGKALAWLAKDKLVLEVGSYCGRSSVWLARTAKSLDCVDTFRCWTGNVVRDTEYEFEQNIKKYGLTDKVCHHVGLSDAVLPTFTRRSFDMVFIDASHDYDSVYKDIKNSLPLLKEDGILVFHDYGRINRDEGVTMAVDELVKNGAEIIDRIESLAVVRPAPASNGVAHTRQREPLGAYQCQT